jgi:PIN domain nuclease of toxin-antitoxin system
MSEAALDASAVLALLLGEPGAEAVALRLPKAVIGAVNAAEVLGKLVGAGMPAADARTALEALGIDVVPFDREQAVDVGALRRVTSSAGLSLGDRACLALARSRAAEAVTMDAAWAGLDTGVRVVVIESGRRRR